MIDLHVHSNHSDGTLSPRELVALAAKISLTAFALTDHDTVSGIPYVKEALCDSNLLFVPGVELSAGYKEKDIHILGYFIDETNPVLLSELSIAIQNRDRRNEEMAHRFQSLSIPVTLAELRLSNPDTVITRAHFARYLIEHNYVSSMPEAFAKYLAYDAPCFVPREYQSPERAIEIIKLAGGVPVLAHPLLYKLSPEELCSLIEHLKSFGLSGIEVFYSSNTVCDENILRGYANRFHLLMTGGSDFHGSNKPGLFLGTGRNNNLNVPDELLLPLKEASKSLSE